MAQAEKFGPIITGLGKAVGSVILDRLINKGIDTVRDLLPEEKAQVQRFGGLLRGIGRTVGSTVADVGRDAARDLGNRLIGRGADALRDLLPEEKAQVQRFGSILRGIGRTVGHTALDIGRDAARDLGGRLIDRGADALIDLLPQAQLQQFSDEEMLNFAELCCRLAMSG